MRNKTLNAKTKRAINLELANWCRQYHLDTPLSSIGILLESKDCILLMEDNRAFSGFLCGESGHIVFPVGAISSGINNGMDVQYMPYQNTMFVLSWYQIKPKCYEIVAYMS